MQPRSPPLTFVAALALLAAQGASVLHLAFARHTRCLEHGEFIDTAETGRDSQPAGFGIGAATSASVHEHEHCVVWLGQRYRTAGVISHHETSSATCERPFLPPKGLSAGCILPLSFAPKQSPPAA